MVKNIKITQFSLNIEITEGLEIYVQKLTNISKLWLNFYMKSLSLDKIV